MLMNWLRIVGWSLVAGFAEMCDVIVRQLASPEEAVHAGITLAGIAYFGGLVVAVARSVRNRRGALNMLTTLGFAACIGLLASAGVGLITPNPVIFTGTGIVVAIVCAVAGWTLIQLDAHKQKMYAVNSGMEEP